MAIKERARKSLPEFFQQSENISAFMNVFEGMVRDHAGDLTQTLVEQKHPQEMDMDLKEGVAEMLGFEVLELGDQTEERSRQQLQNVSEWIRIKGLEVAMKSFLSSLGFRINDTEVMVSDDYEDFVVASEAPDFDNEQFQYTPHVNFNLTQTEAVDDQFLTADMFEALQQRIKRLAPITTVPHFDYTLKIFADEKRNVVERDNVKGVTTDDYQLVDSDFIGQGNDVNPGSGWAILDQVEFSYIEYVDKVNFGTLSGSINSSTDSLDEVLYSESGVEFIPRPDIGEYKVRFDFINPSFSGEVINAVTLEDEHGQVLAVGEFPDVEILDVNLLGLKMEFIVQESGREYVKAFARDEPAPGLGYGEGGYGEGGYGGGQEPYVSGDEVYTFFTSEYNFAYDQETTFDLPLKFDKGLEFDQEKKIPYLASAVRELGVKEGSYAVGDLDGFDGDLNRIALEDNDLWNIFYESGQDFSIYYRDGLDELVFEADLVKSQLYGKTPQQLGIYDSSGNLIIVSQFDQFSINKQEENKWFQLVMETV